jgi:hypothetical protein
MPTDKPTLMFSITCVPCCSTNFVTDKHTQHNAVEAACLLIAREAFEETQRKVLMAIEMLCTSSGVEFEIMTDDHAVRLAMTGLEHLRDNQCSTTMMELNDDGTIKRATHEAAIDDNLRGKRTDH